MLSMNNEIELCEVRDPDCKQLIEKQLLKERISYFIKWGKPSLLPSRRHLCTICVNENVREVAEDVVRDICDEYGYSVKFLMRKSHGPSISNKM